MEVGIRALEDDECLNAGQPAPTITNPSVGPTRRLIGTGSNLTYDGSVECDASIMNNRGDFGAVGATTGTRLPSRLL